MSARLQLLGVLSVSAVVLLLLGFPQWGWSLPSKGKVLVVRKEIWRLCGSVALDPRDHSWSCCRDFYPFHRPTQRCCQTWKAFTIIPKNPKKSEAEDCRSYTLETPVFAGLPVNEPI